jgi:uncharacterized damage-inducible protein DinB
MVRPDHVLDSWKSVRQDTIAAVQDFPADEFDFRPAPEVMTFGETARHILYAGHGLAGMLLAGQDNFATADFRERIKEQNTDLPPNSSQAELCAALRESVEQRAAQFAAQSPEFFAQIITRMDGQKVTRLEMLGMIKEHELTHRAHLFLCLRMKGLTPASTRRRAAQQAAQ